MTMMESRAASKKPRSSDPTSSLADASLLVLSPPPGIPRSDPSTAATAGRAAWARLGWIAASGPTVKLKFSWGNPRTLWIKVRNVPGQKGQSHRVVEFLRTRPNMISPRWSDSSLHGG